MELEFDYGSVQHSEGVCQISNAGEVLNDCYDKFSRNYWGYVDKEQWKANKEAVKDGNSEIKAQYKHEDTVIHIIFFKIDDYRYTAACTGKEYEEGFYTSLVERLRERGSMTMKKRKLFMRG